MPNLEYEGYIFDHSKTKGYLDDGNQLIKHAFLRYQCTSVKIKVLSQSITVTDKRTNNSVT